MRTLLVETSLVEISIANSMLALVIITSPQLVAISLHPFTHLTFQFDVSAARHLLKQQDSAGGVGAGCACRDGGREGCREEWQAVCVPLLPALPAYHRDAQEQAGQQAAWDGQGEGELV